MNRLLLIFIISLAIILLACLLQRIGWGEEINWDKLVSAVIQVESSGNPNAVSEDGCRGLMQISEIVFKEYQSNLRPPPQDIHFDYPPKYWNFDNMFNPYSNKEVGIWYLHRLKDHYLKSDYTIERMLSAYNGGITRLKKLLREGKDWQDMPRESVSYVKKVLKFYKRGKD